MISLPDDWGTRLVFIAIGLVVFVAFVFVARLVGRMATEQLRLRQVRGDVIVVVQRIAVFAVLILGLLAALGFALQSANVALFGLVLATVVAAFGVQDVLKDYVSGYYILLERHIKVGNQIAFDLVTGTVVEIKLRVTVLKSDSGDTIVVPNSRLFSTAVTVSSGAAEGARTEPPK
jgi:small-conductance mechanosensitive channel